MKMFIECVFIECVTPINFTKEKFLVQEGNKVSLIKFLIQERRSEKYLEKLGNLRKVLFVTCEEKCWNASRKKLMAVSFMLLMLLKVELKL